MTDYTHWLKLQTMGYSYVRDIPNESGLCKAIIIDPQGNVVSVIDRYVSAATNYKLLDEWAKDAIENGCVIPGN